MSRKNTCTREDILREQERLKREPDMMKDVKRWIITHREWKEWKKKQKEIKQEQQNREEDI